MANPTSTQTAHLLALHRAPYQPVFINPTFDAGVLAELSRAGLVSLAGEWASLTTAGRELVS